jgi:hypothetical protein
MEPIPFEVKPSIMVVNGQGIPYLLFNRVEDPDEQRNRVSDPACREAVRILRASVFERMMCMILSRA